MMKEFLNRNNLSLIIISYCTLVAFLYTHLSSLLIIFGTFCLLLRVAYFLGKMPLIPRLLTAIIAISSSVLVVILLREQGLFSLMFHLIFLGFSLKFLELKSVRDVYFFVNTAFVLLAVFFIFNTAISSALMASILLFLLLATLLSLHDEFRLKKPLLKLLMKSVLLSLPLAFVLFIIMPRLPSLWKMPIQKQATTGLSDRVSPGEIAKLSRSSALAFRATFLGDPVSANNRYWRAMTLDNFDGKTWSQSQQLQKEESEAKRGEGHHFYATAGKAKKEYELIIEPHYNQWVPVLDYSVTVKNLTSLSDYSLRSNEPIVTRKAFSILQTKKVKNKALTEREKKQFTQLPTAGNSKTDSWITANLNHGMSKENILLQLLTGFSHSFTYTLQPPLLGENQIDDFLFQNQAGFCVHYASSYLYVARRLGFSARMVTGYLGGEWQASEGFFTIRQYDAHAWVEIWKDNRWQRIDPTAYVSPERVESGLQAALTDSNEFLAGEFFSLEKHSSLELVNMLRMRLAQLDYLWARYVVNFDNKKQLQLMQRWLSYVPWLNIAYIVMTLMAIIFTVLIMLIFKPWQAEKIASEDKIYLQLQKHIQKRGLMRMNGQTVSTYCLQLHETLGVPKTLCEHFSHKYNEIKYQQIIPHSGRKKQLAALNKISKMIQVRSQ